jgi:flagellin
MLQVGPDGQSTHAIDVGYYTSEAVSELDDVLATVASVLGQPVSANQASSLIDHDGFQNMISHIDSTLLININHLRAALGAIQNRLEFTMENLDISRENLSASQSRIRDADMALEMMRLTQANVLQQAATAMLAQGNMAPQSILQLLG